MFILAFLVVVESIRLLLGQRYEPVRFHSLILRNDFYVISLICRWWWILTH